MGGIIGTAIAARRWIAFVLAAGRVRSAFYCASIFVLTMTVWPTLATSQTLRSACYRSEAGVIYNADQLYFDLPEGAELFEEEEDDDFPERLVVRYPSGFSVVYNLVGFGFCDVVRAAPSDEVFRGPTQPLRDPSQRFDWSGIVVGTGVSQTGSSSLNASSGKYHGTVNSYTSFVSQAGFAFGFGEVRGGSLFVMPKFEFSVGHVDSTGLFLGAPTPTSDGQAFGLNGLLAIGYFTRFGDGFTGFISASGGAGSTKLQLAPVPGVELVSWATAPLFGVGGGVCKNFGGVPVSINLDWQRQGATTFETNILGEKFNRGANDTFKLSMNFYGGQLPPDSRPPRTIGPNNYPVRDTGCVSGMFRAQEF